jgi:hypothetical protein
MKKHYLLLSFLTMILFSCETYFFPTQEDESEDVVLCPISFSLAFEKEVLPFPTARAIPEDPNGTISEPEYVEDDTDGGDTTGPDVEDTYNGLFSTVEYVVYKNETEGKYEYEKHRKKKSKDGYINLSDTLAPGKYMFYFFCHNSGESASYSNGVVTLDSVSDSFFGKAEVELNMDTREQPIKVERVVSRIELISSDKLLNAYKEFHVETDKVANSFDIVKGTACVPDTGYSCAGLYKLSQSDVGKNDITFSFYTLVAEENSISVKTSLSDGNGNVIKEVNIPNITPVVNNIIRYKGSFFDPATINNSFIISVGNSSWEESDAFPIPEQNIR